MLMCIHIYSVAAGKKRVHQFKGEWEKIKRRAL